MSIPLFSDLDNIAHATYREQGKGWRFCIDVADGAVGADRFELAQRLAEMADWFANPLEQAEN